MNPVDIITRCRHRRQRRRIERILGHRLEPWQHDMLEGSFSWMAGQRPRRKT